MTPEEFVEACLRTESNNFGEIRTRLHEIKTIRLLHAAMGLVTEAGEFLDGLKKYIFYGKNLDDVNLKEELGDSDWYKAIAANELATSFEEIQAMVIAKLEKRYGKSFTEKGATIRDLAAERQVLETHPEVVKQMQIHHICRWCEKPIVNAHPANVYGVLLHSESCMQEYINHQEQNMEED